MAFVVRIVNLRPLEFLLLFYVFLLLLMQLLTKLIRTKPTIDIHIALGYYILLDRDASSGETQWQFSKYHSLFLTL